MTHALDGERSNGGGGAYGSRGSVACHPRARSWLLVIWFAVSCFSTVGEGLTAKHERRTSVRRTESPAIDEDTHDQAMGEEAHHDHGIKLVPRQSATAHHEQPQVAALQPIEHVVGVRNAVGESELLRRVARQQKPCARRQPTKPGKHAGCPAAYPSVMAMTIAVSAYRSSNVSTQAPRDVARCRRRATSPSHPSITDESCTRQAATMLAQS